ncbi:MAG: hypothetical protein FWG00_00355 [Coriobacteriia bacterium]|nr:hypothetical protein [Coriobacteriia bacterium]
MATPTIDTVIDNLKKNDYTTNIRAANAQLPQLCNNFLASLDEKQRKAVDKVFSPNGKKKLYVQLVDMPTPPVVVTLAQPAVFEVVPEVDVAKAGIAGLKLTADDLKTLLANKSGDIASALSGLKGQTMTVLGILAIFAPLLMLGQAELADIAKKAGEHFAPLGKLFY